MTPNELIAVLQILGKYLDNGMDTKWFFGAEHDIVYFYVESEKCPEDSEDGKALVELGLFLDADTDQWAKFT